MSDISVLSQEYRTAAEFSQAISQALILLKKYYLSLPGNETMEPEQLATSRQSLAAILTELVAELDTSGRRKLATLPQVLIPGSLVAQLSQEHRGDLDYFLQDLEAVANRLGDLATRLGQEDLNTIDAIALAANEQTTRVFRRLMRR